MSITTSPFIIDLGVTVIKGFRISFFDESNILIRFNNEASFNPSFPSNWLELSQVSRQSFINNHPTNSCRILLNLEQFQFTNLNSNYLNYAIARYQFGSLVLGISYDNIANICIYESLVSRQLSFPFALQYFNFDPQPDIHYVNFLSLQLRAPMTGVIDLNTIFNPPNF